VLKINELETITDDVIEAAASILSSGLSDKRCVGSGGFH
jgi:hypothetical protein